MITFQEMLNESLKGTVLETFKYKVQSKEYTFTINNVKGELRLNIEGGEKFLSTLKTKSIEEAKTTLKGLIDKVGESRFIKMMDTELEHVESKKNDTEWEVYSEFNTTRGSTAFKIYSRIKNGKMNWNQEPRTKKYLSIHMSSKEEDVKKEIEDEVKKSKLKYVQGYNPLDKK